MARWMTAALACLALALGGALLAGCGDDDEGDDAAQTQEAAPAETTPAPGDDGGGDSGGGNVEVSMKDVKFIPMEITAKVGQTVVWTNDDGFPHTVTATKGEDFDSGNVDGGGTFEYKLEKAGEIDYVCEIHPGQEGSITVTE